MKQLELVDHRIKMLFIASLCIFLSSCKQTGEQTESNKTTPSKPTSVCDTNYYAKFSDLETRQKIDEAKWNLYLYAAIDTPKNEDGSYAFKTPKSYASYPLVLDTLYGYKESTFTLFSFCIDGELLTPEKAINLGVRYVPETVSFSKYNGKEERCVRWRGINDGDNLCMTTLSEEQIQKLPKHFTKKVLAEMKTSMNRLIYSLNPVVVNYIEANQKDLDPWFINEAKKRGVIKKITKDIFAFVSSKNENF